MNVSPSTANEYKDLFLKDADLLDEILCLSLPLMDLNIQSNSKNLLNTLENYFQSFQMTEQTAFQKPTVDIIAVESMPLEINHTWIHWSREAGKSSNPKDAYIDIVDGRLIRKVRTGMTFLQSDHQKLAIGPCEQNSNQIINFINSQYFNYLQQEDFVICHAAAVSYENQAMAIAGFSGGGKSTLMLHLLEHPKLNFVSNDRLFIKNSTPATPPSSQQLVQAHGTPKLPRVNPGTLLNNKTLLPILSEERQKILKTMPKQELWNLEEKYDVDVSQVYGPKRIKLNPILKHVVLLNWSHESQEPTQMNIIDPASKPELLKAIMKSSGPFYQQKDGRFYQDNSPLDEATYLKVLSNLNVYEVSGQVDFDQLKTQCYLALGLSNLNKSVTQQQIA